MIARQLLKAVRNAPNDQTLYTFKMDKDGSSVEVVKVVYEAPSRIGASWILDALNKLQTDKQTIEL